MATGQLIEMSSEGRDEFSGVLRFYELAKRQEWQVRDLPWGELPPIPEGKGSPERRARRNDMWRSVLTQQLQADMLACDMASQLLNIAPDHEAKLYYSTMVQDESRHTEAWLKLVGEAGGTAERDPHLDNLAHMTLEADTVEEKVFLMQVFYERLIISRFRLIARSSRGTVRTSRRDHGFGLRTLGDRKWASAQLRCVRGNPAGPGTRDAAHAHSNQRVDSTRRRSVAPRSRHVALHHGADG